MMKSNVYVGIGVWVLVLSVFSSSARGSFDMLDDSFLDKIDTAIETKSTNKFPIIAGYTQPKIAIENPFTIDSLPVTNSFSDSSKPSVTLLNDFPKVMQNVRGDKHGKLLMGSFTDEKFIDGLNQCSLSARLGLQILTGLPLNLGVTNEGKIRQGDAITLIEQGLQQGLIVPLDYVDYSIEEILDGLYDRYQATLFDVYIDKRGDDQITSWFKKGHRMIVFLADDDTWNIIDPTVYPYSSLPIPLQEYRSNEEFSKGDWYIRNQGYRLPEDLRESISIKDTILAGEIPVDNHNKQLYSYSIQKYTIINQTPQGSLTMRENHRLSSDRIGQIPSGVELEVLDQDDSGWWFKVEYYGVLGRISAKYTTPFEKKMLTASLEEDLVRNYVYNDTVPSVEEIVEGVRYFLGLHS